MIARAQSWITARIAELGPHVLPFADVATADLPLARVLRLSLFQISVGMCMVLLTGTLNRVMITELGIAATIVAAMVSLPLIFAPLRLLVGIKSDRHRSAFGWRRVPYIWTGSLLMYGGLSTMPFALLILAGDAVMGPVWAGQISAAFCFLLVGAGLHTVQTAGLALATDLVPEKNRPRIVALLYVMLLVGMTISALVLGALLHNFSPVRLIQVIQATALIAIVINVVALWKQEPRDRERATRPVEREPTLVETWRQLASNGKARRLLLALGLGTAAFSMQDVLLEPYGGEVLGMGVGATTMLTALFAGGSLAGFALAGRRLANNADPFRLAALGLLAGVGGFAAIVLAGPLESAALFRTGTLMAGFGSGLFAVAMMTAAMAEVRGGESGLVLGAWGAVQATAAGLAVAFGGAARDAVGWLAQDGALGPALSGPLAGYGFVYHVEIALLFTTLAVLGPLVRPRPRGDEKDRARVELLDLPG